MIETVLDCPAAMDDGAAVGTPADGGTHEPTVTVVAGLSAGCPHWPDTRTQYEVVAVGLTVAEELVCPLSGLDVFPETPVYH